MADNVIQDFPLHSSPIERFHLGEVSWGAIWAGAMVNIGMEALFLSFGIFIGAVFGGSVVWSMAWYLVTMAVSFFIGAQTAARLSDAPNRQVSVLHGLSTWGLATLATTVIGLVVGWAALRMGFALAAAAPGPLTVHAPVVWGAVEEWGGLIWGGIFLSLGAAYVGGSSGAPRTDMGAREPIPSAPIRRAS